MKNVRNKNPEFRPPLPPVRTCTLSIPPLPPPPSYVRTFTTEYSPLLGVSTQYLPFAMECLHQHI